MKAISDKEWKRLREQAREIALDEIGGSIPDVLLSYQKELLSTTAANDVTVVEKSRRTGITWAAAADAVLNAAAGRDASGQDVFYIGYNLEMAREFIDVCGMWAKSFNSLAGDVEEFLFTDSANNSDGDKDIKAFRIKFASGFEIIALPSNPRSLRGMQGYVIIDEAAFHDNLDELLKAAFALLLWGGKLLVISTHNGVDNAFNQLIEDIRKNDDDHRPALLRLTFDEALSDGLYERICLVKGKEEYSEAGEETWKQKIFSYYGDAAEEELNVIPRSSSGGWLPYTLIDARMRAEIPVIRIERPDEFKHVAPILREQEIGDWLEKCVKPLLDKLHQNLNYALGGDFGRTGDGSVFWPIAILQNTARHTPFLVEIHNMPFSEQQQILFYICDHLPNKIGIALDARGIGAQMAEACRDKYGSMVHEIQATESWYRDNMPPLKGALEDDMFSLPRDVDIAQDFRSVEIIRGIPRVPEKRKKGKNGKKRHGDSVIAAALAEFASKQRHVEYAYIPVPRASQQTDKPRNRRHAGRSRFGNNRRNLM